ncbi:MAG: hypothetical protein LCH76_00610 [Actinobacteria bacterium]|nr:hypothetical protein [Actinomycetota bacterium]
MSEWLVEKILGDWGQGLLAVYQANAVLINLVILAYGALLLFGYWRLGRYRAEVVRQVEHYYDTYRKRRSINDAEALERLVVKSIDWAAVAGVGPGKLVVGKWRLWPNRATAERLPRLIPLAEVSRDVIDGWRPRGERRAT